VSFGKAFLKTYGHGTRYRECGPAEQARLAPVVPEFLLDHWRSDGWAGYRDGLLWTIDPRDFEPVVRAWNLPDKPPVAVARTAFGSLYLLREFVTPRNTTGYAILELDPHVGDYALVGPSAELFLSETLAQRDYIKTVMEEGSVRRAVRDHGELTWDEMYGYEPALALGGSRNPENVRRFNIFAHHALLSQLVEVRIRKL